MGKSLTSFLESVLIECTEPGFTYTLTSLFYLLCMLTGVLLTLFTCCIPLKILFLIAVFNTYFGFQYFAGLYLTKTTSLSSSRLNFDGTLDFTEEKGYQSGVSAKLQFLFETCSESSEIRSSESLQIQFGAAGASTHLAILDGLAKSELKVILTGEQIISVYC